MHPLIQQSFILCNHPSTSTRQAICTIFKGKPLLETALGDINLTKPCPGMHWLVIIVFGAASQTTLILDKTHFSHQALWLGGKYFWERSVLADYKQTRLVDEKGMLFCWAAYLKTSSFSSNFSCRDMNYSAGHGPSCNLLDVSFISFLLRCRMFQAWPRRRKGETRELPETEMLLAHDTRTVPGWARPSKSVKALHLWHAYTSSLLSVNHSRWWN